MEDIDGGLHPAVDGQSLDEMRLVVVAVAVAAAAAEAAVSLASSRLSY